MNAGIGIGFPNWRSGLIDLTILFKQICEMVVVYARSALMNKFIGFPNEPSVQYRFDDFFKSLLFEQF